MRAKWRMESMQPLPDLVSSEMQAYKAALLLLLPRSRIALASAAVLLPSYAH